MWRHIFRTWWGGEEGRLQEAGRVTRVKISFKIRGEIHFQVKENWEFFCQQNCSYVLKEVLQAERNVIREKLLDLEEGKKSIRNSKYKRLFFPFNFFKSYSCKKITTFSHSSYNAFRCNTHNSIRKEGWGVNGSIRLQDFCILCEVA